MGDRLDDGLLKNRTALSDVSNQLGKRKFVSISTTSDSNNGSENNQKNMVNEIGKSTFLRKDYTVGGECVEGTLSDITKNPSGCNAVSNIFGSNGESMNAGDLTSNKASSIRGSIPLSESKESESEKCVAFDAAYIWTDLQYQDTKGRISALKKSRKDVRSVIERSCSYGGFGKNVQGTSNKPTKLEHDLMSQWRSLFLHTEDVLIRENSQLQSSLQNLKDLRDHCKVDLETTNAASSKC
ncbi:hypothetical protein AQUCO_06600040v1 [Aquilegia coerulea]|uniref:Uncharacterized protein n=1 Tax=Aquilegia coerulea TaxID=218851 RepID=A0A2G5CDC3_AQUCA|nr:hypothetical protein AQUCO_06600040v1 [Aquilegia coerulea]